MATTAFPVRQAEDGTGCTDVAMRKIMGALYPGRGIVSGLAVTGGATAAYSVAPGVAVCSKGEGDGNTLAYCEGGTVACSANAGSYPRRDVVWVTSHDLTQGDPDNLVTLGVTEGTPAAAPVDPEAPSYATPLAVMEIPAGAADTSQAAVVSTGGYAIPYGACTGLLVKRRYITNANVNISKQKTLMSQYFDLPTDRTVTFKCGTCMTPRDRDTSSTSSSKGEARVNVYVYLDGEQVAWLSNYCDEWATMRVAEVTVTVPAGRHLARMDVKAGTDWTTARFWYSANGSYPGQSFQAFDMGPVVATGESS